MAIIETRNLRFCFKKQEILQDLCLSVPEGSIYGYLGLNGSGKTTTIRLLLGLLTPLQGQILFQGKEFHEHRLSVLSEVGVMVGAPSYYADLTARENLQGLDYMYRIGENRVNEVLKLVGLETAADKKVRKFSTGMKQRLAIAMAVFHDPGILFLDEPMNGLDPEGVHEIRHLLLRLHQEGKTIFCSSHILSEMDKICTHIGILKDGQLKYEGTLVDLLRKVERRIYVKCADAEALGAFLKTHWVAFSFYIPGVVSVITDTKLTFQNLLNLLTASGVTIDTIESDASSLESVFLKIISV